MKIRLLVARVLFAATVVLIGCPTIILAQSKRQQVAQKKAAVVTRQLGERRFAFQAEYIIPMQGPTRLLNDLDYDLRITPDSVICYLPYFGRTYTAAINTIDVGLKFTSTDFDYSAASGKKGSRNITIRLKDNRDVRTLALNIQENGSAVLQVSSSGRDPISYSGYIREGNL